MRPTVVDASAMVEYLLRTGRGQRVEGVVREPDTDLSIPALCDVEVASVLRRALLAQRLTPPRAGEALTDYGDLPLTRHGHQLLLGRVLELRENFSAYDATYVALAERLEARLVTADGALGRAVARVLDLEVVGV